MKNKMLFCVQCHRFNYRLAWQLSSIAQQDEFKPSIHIATSKIGNPDFDSIIEKFPDLDIYVKYYPISSERFRKRGCIRNDQLGYAVNNRFELIYFADCDIVYNKMWFEALLNYKITKCTYVREKIHTEPTETQETLLNEPNPLRIEDAYEKAAQITRIDKRNKPVSAGNFQLCTMDEIARKTGGIYVDENKNKDNDFIEQGQKARSDIQFRKKMGGSNRIIMVSNKHAIHLQHRRDGEVGYHLELDR